MWTVTQLARRCNLSRGTLLYYESIGLLKPAARSQGNYRKYGQSDLSRLQQICLYRDAGLKLADIRRILDRRDTDASAILKARLAGLSAEIEKLRGNQGVILNILKNHNWSTKMVTKEKWVSVMKASGLSEGDMFRWHAEFERSAPDEHQEFLEFLHIPTEEIRSIRSWSQAAGESGRV